MTTSSFEDDAAFGRQLADLASAMRAFAITLCRNRVEADDIVQAALLKAWQGRASFVPGTNLKAWLFAIVRNHFYSLTRKHRWHGEMSELEWERIEAPPSPVDAMFELDALRRALGQLPVEQREAVILVGAGGLSYDEVAVMTGCPIGTIKSRLSRGRASLLAALEESAVPSGEFAASNAFSDILWEVEDRKQRLGQQMDSDVLAHAA